MIRNFFSFIGVVVALMFSCPQLSNAANEGQLAARDEAIAQADREAFEANMNAYKIDVAPFLAKHCIACHGPKQQEGDLSLDSLDADMKESTSGARWAVVRQKLESQEMPPEDKAQPAEKEVARVLAWIKSEMKRSRRNFTRRLQVVNGNETPHAPLFDPKNIAELDVEPRIRRQSPEIYEVFRKEQAKGFENLVGNPFTADPRYTFRDMGAPKVDLPTTSQLLRNALTIVQRETGHTFEDGKLNPMVGSKREFLEFIDPTKKLDRATMEKAVTLQFRRTLNRDPNVSELKRFADLMEKNVAEAGRVDGVRYSLCAVFLLPEAIFRYEVGEKAGNNGTVRLAPREIAFALAYALTDDRPPQWLLNQAAEGELANAAGVASAVERMWLDEKLNKPRILRFFHEYFEYPRATEVFKNADDFKAHKAKVLVSDTDNLVLWILERDKNVLAELLTTNRAFINSRVDAKTKKTVPFDSKSLVHLSYNLPPDWKWTDEQPISLPASARAGVLTQPSWLVAFSMNEDNHAILRGKWVRERLLGNVVPDIPITVDAQLPDEPNETLRHRMRVTREKYCWQCHELMNPVGMPFEMYDHFGRWRALEQGEPVNASGQIASVGDDRLTADVQDAVELMHQLAQSERVEQVFVRHVFRYFTGRNENVGDGPALRAAHHAYRQSDGSFRALVTAILASDSFLYRTTAEIDQKDE